MWWHSQEGSQGRGNQGENHPNWGQSRGNQMLLHSQLITSYPEFFPSEVLMKTSSLVWKNKLRMSSTHTLYSLYLTDMIPTDVVNKWNNQVNLKWGSYWLRSFGENCFSGDCLLFLIEPICLFTEKVIKKNKQVRYKWRHKQFQFHRFKPR